MKGRNRLRRTVALVMAVSFVLMLLLASPGLATSKAYPRIIPPQAKPHGMTYADWGARWWKWLYGIPASVSPVLDDTGANAAQGQSGPVWFWPGPILKPSLVSWPPSGRSPSRPARPYSSPF